MTLNFFSDEDLAGDLLLAESKFPLKKILPQMQKKFQVIKIFTLVIYECR